MLQLRMTITGFLMYARQLIFGVRDDTLIRERITKYAYDDARIAECVQAYYDAEKAQSDRLKEYGEQLGSKEISDQKWEDAKTIWQEHGDLLRLTVRNDIEKQRKLFLIGMPGSNRMSDWFEHMKAMYDRVLADEAVITAAGRYGLTREILETGRQTVVDAEEAKRMHSTEQAEAEEATELRNAAFVILQDVVEDLETICPYILKDHPQRLERLGIRVYSPGYKPKKKKEGPTSQDPQEDPQEEPQEEPTPVTEQ